MKNSALLRTICLFVLSAHVLTAQTTKTLGPLTSFGPSSNGRIEPTSADPVLDIGTNQRGLGVDPVTGNLVLVDTHSGSGGSAAVQGNIFVLNGDTGLTIGSLNTNGIAGGSYADTGAVISDDGAVYVCNQVNSSATTAFTIYRWASVTSTDAPTTAFSGTITPAQRYGASLDIRGGGANTQIIIGSTPQGGTSGTNVVIFTTADGITFSATSLACPDVTAANFQEGIAFGEGNTFWAKKIGAPLRLMSFNLATQTATTLASYDTNALPGSLNFGPLAVDSVNHLLAAIEVRSGTTASERVFLYDISNTNKAPVMLDLQTYNPNNGNSTAPPGYLHFKGNRLYSHVINNGIAAFSIDSASTPLPTIFMQPAPSTRLVSGQSFSLVVGAYPAVTYQWQKNGGNVLNATNASLNFNNIQASDSGTYRVVVSNSAGSVTSDNAVLAVVNLADLYHFNTLWSAVPGTQTYVTKGGGNSPKERNIGYNSLSNQVLVVYAAAGSLVDYGVNVVDANTGTNLYKLNTNGVRNVQSEITGSNPLMLCGIGVADDGAVYICNESPNAGGGGNVAGKVFSTNNYFRIYRWSDSGPTATPVQIFEGDPMAQSGNFRWGDVMAVRGSGTNTQIILDNQNTGSRYFALLMPADETMTNWTVRGFFQESTLAFGTSIGRSLQFGVNAGGNTNVMFQKRRGSTGGSLLQGNFDPTVSGTLNIAGNEGAYPFTNQLSGIWLNQAAKVGAGINVQANGVTTPDAVELYDISDLTAPLKLASYNFPQNHDNNGNFIGWGVWSNNRFYALAGNNGILAMELVSGPPGPPVFTRHPRDVRAVVGGSASLDVVLDSTASVRWQKDGSNIPSATGLTYTINNATTNDAGFYRCIATNAFGATTSLVANVIIERLEDNYTLQQLWGVTANSQPYLTSNGGSGTPNERSIAYNPSSNRLYLPQKTGAGAWAVNVIDGSNGALLYTLNTTGVFMNVPQIGGSGGVALDSIALGGDGSIYACDMTVDSAGTSNPDAVFRVYRWANDASDTVPVQVFSGEPSPAPNSLRWGDSMAVRGSGTDTEIVMDANGGTYGTILKPTDSTLSTFASFPWVNAAGGGSIGRSLQFDSGATLWQKRKGGALMLSSYNTNTQSSALITNQNVFPTTLGPVAVDLGRNLVIGLDFVGSTNTPDVVSVYNVSTFSPLLLVAKYSIGTNQNANGNFIGQVVLSGNKVFALDANNGLAAFNLVPPANSAPPSLSVSHSGSSVTLTWADSTAILQSTSSLNPASWSDASAAGQTTVTESAATGMKFYRLRK